MKLKSLVILGGLYGSLVHANQLTIVGVVDGPLAGGLPKAVELRVDTPINDLSECGIGIAVNGKAEVSQSFKFGEKSADIGTYVTVSMESAGFEEFFDISPDYVYGGLSINGDDGIHVFCNGETVDTFGVLGEDGSGTAWEYKDGWASFHDGGHDGPDFDVANWQFSGPGALNGETKNSTAANPYPIRSTGGSGGGGGGGEPACFNCPSLDKVADAANFNAVNYYQAAVDAINAGQNSEQVKNIISGIISADHKVLTYSEVWTALTHTDEDPNNSDNVILWYKGTSLAKNRNGSGSQSSNPDNWNREHSWPKSHGFSSQSNEAYTDIHHLRPTDISVNASRGNLDFDDSDNPLPEAPENRLDNDSFEPRDDIKGDVARMMFYMDTRYQGLSDTTPDLSLVDRITSVGEPSLGKLCRLVEWHNEDPVDAAEEARHDAIYEYQGNRNPFIDNPQWVATVFGDACDGSGGGGGGNGDTPKLLISEYIEGSSSNKAIEIYNLGDQTVDLSASNVSLNLFSNGSDTISSAISLTGTIAANSTFVVVNNSAEDSLKALADMTSNSLGHNGDDAYTLSVDGVVVDTFGQVGVDPGNNWGTDDTATKDRSLVRKASVISGDTVSNDEFEPSAEWVGFPKDTFSNLGSHEIDDEEPSGFGQCGDERTLISAIQGSGASSPMVNETVIVEAVVTQVTSGLGGFFIQQVNDDQDNNPQTSEGLFVFSDHTVEAGQVLRMQGEVSEFFGKTQLRVSEAPLHCGSDTVAPVSIALPFESTEAAEAWEGMLVTFDNALTVSSNFDLARYGEVTLSSKRLFNPTNVFAPNSVQALALADENERNQLLLDDGMNGRNPSDVIYPTGGLDAQNTLRNGDLVTSLVGSLDYSFGSYRLIPSAAPHFEHVNQRPVMAEQNDNQVTVASFNVLNLFNGDGEGGGFPTSRGADNSEEYQRQLDKVVAAIELLNADIIGLMEIENDGVDSNSAVSQLVAALNANMGEGTYDFVNAGGLVGDDEISVAMLYKPARVSLVGNAKVNNDSIFDRAPLAQAFSFGDEKPFAVVVNHFKSKGSCSRASGLDEDQGDGQGCFNDRRVKQANALNAWLNSLDGFADVPAQLIIGDLNAYAKEDPITALENAGFANLMDNEEASGYSFMFDGKAGYLDHAMASELMADAVTSSVFVAINADEPRALDYNLEDKSDTQQTTFYQADAYRSSDHDPVLVTLEFAPTPTKEVAIDRVKHLIKDHQKALKQRLALWRKDVALYQERLLRLAAEIRSLDPIADAELISEKRAEIAMLEVKHSLYSNYVAALDAALGNSKQRVVNIEQGANLALIQTTVESHLKSFKSKIRNRNKVGNRLEKRARKAERQGNKKRAREQRKRARSHKATAQAYRYLFNIANAYKL